MKICVVGAGAIGGFLAVRLAQVGHAVSVVIRGAHLEAVQSHGMTLISEDDTPTTQTLTATNQISSLPPQDLVILGMKAHQLASVAEQIPALLRPDSLVMSLQNGIPWWYFQKHGGPHEGKTISAVDPNGLIARSINPAQVIGSLAYPACELIEPGVIRQIEGNRFPVGEIDGSDTERVRGLAELLRGAGFKSPVVSDIRSEIWLKLWGNVSFNPISALTHATLQSICEYQPSRDLARAMMTEAQAVGSALGVQFKVDIERRINGAQAVGQHKTSMLQDVEQGRQLELDALVKSVLELAQLSGVATPVIAHVYALASLLSRSLAGQRLSIAPA